MTHRSNHWMTALESYAHRGSISYGPISPERFAEIVKGAQPENGETSRVCQGLTETHASSINREAANDLAKELGMTRAALEARCQELCGERLGESAFPAELPLPPRLWQKGE